MKWCCSPFSTGITIGSFYIVGSVIAFIFKLVLYFEYEERVLDPERREDLKYKAMKAMIICGITVLISSLYIVAIVKRCHYLILPWLLFAFYVFYVTLNMMYWWFIGAGMGGASGTVFLILLLIAVASIAVEITIFCFSWSLFKHIRNENMEKSERAEEQAKNKNLI